MTRRSFLSAVLFAGAARAQSPSKPNVVFFMTDDHGAWALNAYGCSEFHTPNIDRLAARGSLFERAFAATPVCSPSREKGCKHLRTETWRMYRFSFETSNTHVLRSLSSFQCMLV